MKKTLFISLFVALFSVSCNISNDEIHYTTSDGTIIKPHSNFDKYPFGQSVSLMSNSYNNGVGILKFNAPVTKLGDVFYNCSDKITSITIPNSVTTIENSIFRYCNMVAFYGKFSSSDNKSLVVNGVLSAFASGAGMIEYSIPKNVKVIGNAVFDGCRSLEKITIHNGVTHIGDSAFTSCNIKSITIPESVKHIGNAVFMSCNYLKSFQLPKNLDYIGYGVFFGCANLNQIDIPDKVTYIGDNAFLGCSLTHITIPKNVAKIGIGAFAYCNNLTKVYCQAKTPPQLSQDVFKYYINDKSYILPNLKIIYVPKESVDAYKVIWKEYAHLIKPYDFE